MTEAPSRGGTRPLATAAALALALAACGRKPEPPPAPRAAAPPAAPLPPLTFKQTTASAEVDLTLPEAVGRIAPLYARLYAEGRNDLAAFVEGSQSELDDLRASGQPANAYARSIRYAVTAQTPRLISLARSEYENTGGAHPNDTLAALVWDKPASREVTPKALFRAGADMAGADKALCDAIAAAKLARVKDAALTGVLKACPPLAAANVALAPSTVAGKAGGLLVLFSTYDLGPRPEGEYRIVLPLAAIQAVIDPAYAGEFAGAPAEGADAEPS